MDEKKFTVKEIAGIEQVSESLVYDWVKLGYLQAERMPFSLLRQKAAKPAARAKQKARATEKALRAPADWVQSAVLRE